MAAAQKFEDGFRREKERARGVGTQDEFLHDVEDVAGRETHTEEVISNGIFEIHVVETDITCDTNYQNYGTTDISAERHEVSLIPSAQDAVQEKIVILGSSETEGSLDTDELSYLKVGIPMIKIFIINPKGEVAVNQRVDTKSYTSLHALVHGMFPPISSSSEQEDYNTWNYWKMPLPDVDL